MRWSWRHALAVAGLTALVVLVAIAGFTIFQGAKPRVSQATATAEAMRQVRQMAPNVAGYAVVSARYDAAPDRVFDDRGNLIFSESHSSCPVWIFQGPAWLCRPDGAWIVHLGAPAQGGFTSYDAYVVVNGQNGTVSSASSTGS